MKQTTNGVLKDFLKKMSGPQLTANWNSCWLCAACCHVKVSEVTINMVQKWYKACTRTLEKQSKGKLRKLYNVQNQNLYC